MSGFPPYVQWVWTLSILFQLIVLALLFAKGNFRKVPRFTAYVVLNICQAGFLIVAYPIYGVDSATTRTLAWDSECLTLLAQALATAEILGIVLKPYRGIWGLAWRALTITSAIVLTLVALAGRGNWALARWFELDRGYHLTFATAVVACLLLVRYYSIPVRAAYKMLLAGFCLYSCTEILINTLLQALLYKSFNDYQPIWQFATTSSFVVVLVIWAAALWKALPIDIRQVTLISDSTYRQLSPEIDEQLLMLNEKLMRLWKLEARSQ